MAIINVVNNKIQGTTGSDTFNSTYTSGTGQLHIYGDGYYRSDRDFQSGGDDTFNLAFENVDGFVKGHHIFGQGGADTFNFLNLHEVSGTVVGRIDDFDASRDRIQIEGQDIDLNNLPSNIRIVEFGGEHNDTGADLQQWLLVETSGGGHLFYALEGARVDMDSNGGSNGGTNETHFVNESNLPDFDTLESVDYVPSQNVVPAGHSPDGGIIINDIDKYPGNGFWRTAPDGYFEDLVNEVIVGTAKGDLIAGGLNDDVVNAGRGNDKVWGGTGHDTLYGKSGDDALYGGRGNDVLNGGTGDDRLDGGTGADQLTGGQGHNTYVIDNAGDQILNEKWWDAHKSTVLTSVDYNDLANIDTIVLTGTDDLSVNANFMDNTIIGNAGDNVMNGGGGNDTLNGGDGDDTLDGGTGADQLTGGKGHNTYVIDNAGDQILNEKWWDEHKSTVLTSVDYNDLAHIDTIVLTGTGALSVNANFMDNTIIGNIGDNFINGRAGDDILNGGTGNDTLTGGANVDIFVFAAGDGADVITDFKDGIDMIEIGGTVLFGDLSISDTPDGALVSYASSSSILLEGITAEMLTQDDFAFV